jgi:hypothetical protein
VAPFEQGRDFRMSTAYQANPLPASTALQHYQIRRARTVARILEDRAQLPDEGLGEFTKDVWRIVEEAIEHICRVPGNQGTSLPTAAEPGIEAL